MVSLTEDRRNAVHVRSIGHTSYDMNFTESSRMETSVTNCREATFHRGGVRPPANHNRGTRCPAEDDRDFHQRR